MKKLFFLACAFTGILYKQKHVDKSSLPEWSVFNGKEVHNFIDENDNEGAVVHTERDSFDYNNYKENVPDIDLIPNEDLITYQKKLRYSEHFANLYGSLQNFVSDFIPEYNIFKQTKDVDETDNKEFYDLNEPMIDIDQDNIEYQEKFGNGNKKILGTPNKIALKTLIVRI